MISVIWAHTGRPATNRAAAFSTRWRCASMQADRPAGTALRRSVHAEEVQACKLTGHQAPRCCAQYTLKKCKHASWQARIGRCAEVDAWYHKCKNESLLWRRDENHPGTDADNEGKIANWRQFDSSLSTWWRIDSSLYTWWRIDSSLSTWWRIDSSLSTWWRIDSSLSRMTLRSRAESIESTMRDIADRVELFKVGELLFGAKPDKLRLILI